MPPPYTKTLEHHGLVAGFCHTLGFADIIDNALGGVSCERKMSYGQLVTAMVINGLGFTGRTLHMYSEYFKDKPLDRLIGEGVLAEHINDDALGRCLGSLYEYCVSTLYQLLGEAVISHLGLATEALHLDSTSFHYDGQATENGESHIRIAQGQLFITRVPQTLNEAKALIKQASTLNFTPITGEYEGVSYDSEYGGVKQKWLLIRSEQAYK